MKAKILNSLLVVFSLIGYLEWAPNNQMFLFESEAEIIRLLFTSPSDIVHPLILLPLSGQILLVITLFQKQPSKWLTVAGMLGLSILLLFIFFIGVMEMNWKITLSVVPFILTMILTIVHLRRIKRVKET